MGVPEPVGENCCRQGRPRWSRLAYVLFACLLPTCLGVSPAFAQGGDVWTPPVFLSRDIDDRSTESLRLSYPVLVADVWGGVHAFWSAVYDASATIGDTLFYSYWDGVVWSTPLDVIYTPGQTIWIPKAAVDLKGWLHLAWTDNPIGQVWYVRAPVVRAGTVNAWSPSMTVPVGLAAGVSIAADADGNVHLVYCAAGGHQGVYHVSSVDGQVWSTPAYVGPLSDSYIEYPECRLSQMFDARGRLHVVWGQNWVKGAPIYYARSEDGGRIWSSPLAIDRKDEKYLEEAGPARPNILAISRDEIHVIWFGAPDSQRWHRWSADGGVTWSYAQQMFADFRGYMEPPAMAADSSGTLHVVSMGWRETEERPFGAFYTYWRDGRWSPLTLVDTSKGEDRDRHIGPIEGGGEFAALAITGGNELHLVWEIALAEIWVSSLKTDAPSVPLMPRPSPPVGSVAQIERSATVVVTPTPSQGLPEATVNPAVVPLDPTLEEEASLAKALLVGVLPSAVLVGGVVLILWVRRRH